MISMRRFLSPSSTVIPIRSSSFTQQGKGIKSSSINNNKHKAIISPWDRTVQAMSNTGSSNGSGSGSSTSGSNYYTNIYRQSQLINYNYSNHNKRSKSALERIVLVIILLIAWGWIMSFLGVIFYHGYQYHQAHSTTGNVDNHNDYTSNKKQLPIEHIQQETSEHQLEDRKITITARDSVTHDRKVLSNSETDADADAAVTTTNSKSTTHLEVGGSPLLIFTYQRANYLQETLSYILQYIPSNHRDVTIDNTTTTCLIGCPIIISQDGNDPDVMKVIDEYTKRFLLEKNVLVIRIEHPTQQKHLRMGSKAIAQLNPYQSLAIHYGWALQQVMDGTAIKDHSTTSITSTIQYPMYPQRVIILEEDIHIAPDFFAYFSAMAPILDTDPTLFAVSAFNDNGYINTVYDPSRVLRSDFFPGLGWMITRTYYMNELQNRWAPNGYWDDWLREPQQRKERHILRPEISRTYHFGTKGGASNNQFGTHLSNIQLNTIPVNWTTTAITTAVPSLKDLNLQNQWSYYLSSPKIYDELYWKMIVDAHVVSTVNDIYDSNIQLDSTILHLRIEYTSMYEFQNIVHQLHVPLMDDEKAGIYRTAYKGIVETRPYGDIHILFITPSMDELRTSFAYVIPQSSSS